MTLPAVEVRDLAFAYPDGHEALRGVDLTVAPGERVAILGPNGAGKTTFVLALNGINVASRGSVVVGGMAVERRNLAEIRRRVGIVFQDPDDQLFMPTVRDDVAFGPANLGLRGAELDLRTMEALDAVGMVHVADRSPHHLSFGERRRVALATVLAMRPDVLVLDEPSSNLDPVARRELAEIVLGLVCDDPARHPRPALRAAALRTRRGARRRPRRRRRPHARRARRPRDDGRPSPRAAVRLRSGALVAFLP